MDDAPDLDVPLLFTKTYGRVVVDKQQDNRLFVPARVVGVGAHGIVELGVWTPLKKTVAIKKCIMSDDMLSRLRAEARALIKCREHPFIVKLLGILQHDRTVYFLLNACTGGDLFFRFHFGLARDGVSAKDRHRHAVFYLQEVVCALEHLHAHGVVHGDVKTENILIDRDGHVQLADFGSVTSLNKAKHVFGMRGSTMHFPPEMVEQQTLSLASDMWTLGCVAFELFTDSRPHPYVMCSGYTTMVEALEQFDMSAEAADFIKRLLHMDPDMRPNIAAVKKHALFANVDWQAVEAKQVPVPWTPRGINVDADMLDMTACGLPDPESTPLFYIVKPEA